MSEVVKRLWLLRVDTPFGLVRIWTLRDYSKAVPVQLYFWDVPKNLWISNDTTVRFNTDMAEGDFTAEEGLQ